MLLRTKGLTKHFGGVKAVEDVSWQIGSGTTHCIIGPNGAGKSTFFQLLVGTLRPTAGEVFFEDSDISYLHPFQRARAGIAVKPQKLGVFDELTVSHNLRLALQRVRGDDEMERDLEKELLELKLGDKRDYLVRELSHGEKQWLGLGMALALEPKLLLLDEPTAGMSAGETSATATLIHSVAKRDIAVVVVEHDMAFVRDLATDITVFHDGRIFATGSLKEIESNAEVRRLYLGDRGAARLRS